MAIAATNAILVTSYKLFCTANGSQQHQIGTAISISPSESRNITDSFVIGSNPPDVPAELIPGIVTGRTLSMHAVAIYGTEVMDVFKTDAQQFIASLSDQSTPFSVQETVLLVAISLYRLLLFSALKFPLSWIFKFILIKLSKSRSTATA